MGPGPGQPEGCGGGLPCGPGRELLLPGPDPGGGRYAWRHTSGGAS